MPSRKVKEAQVNKKPVLKKKRVKKPPRCTLFENGLLNATPKGAEVKLFEANKKQSPLLRLPAEVRNQIYQEVLGGYVLQRVHNLFRSNKPERPYAARLLLQTCRQVYDEASWIPYQKNIFRLIPPHIDRPTGIGPGFSKIHTAHREGISHLQIMTEQSVLPFTGAFQGNSPPLFKETLPGLRRVTLIGRTPSIPRQQLLVQQIESLNKDVDVQVVQKTPEEWFGIQIAAGV